MEHITIKNPDRVYLYSAPIAQINSLIARCASLMAYSVIASDAESVEAILMLPKGRLAVSQWRFSMGHDSGSKAI